MPKELIAEVQALQKKLAAVKENPATWKAARKLEAAADILQRDWPVAPVATAEKAEKSAKQ